MPSGVPQGAALQALVREAQASVGRPPGEIRLALMQAARELYQMRLQTPLVAEDGTLLIGAMADELAQRALVGRKAARVTLKNLVRAPAELRVVGRYRPEWSARSFAVYQPVERQRSWASAPPAVQALSSALQAWVAPGPDAA